MDRKETQKKIHRLSYDAVRIDGSTIVMIDPYDISVTKPADLILISRDRVEHNLHEEVAKVLKEDSVIVTDAVTAKKLQSEVKVVNLGYGSGWVYSKRLKGEVKAVTHGDKLNVKGVEIEIGPPSGVKKDFHPEAGGTLSFSFLLDGVRYYHAGDSDFIPEMKQLEVDIAFLPVSGTNGVTAVQKAMLLQPGIAIPVHYGAPVGSEEDAEKFKKALEGRIEVAILPPEMIRLIGGG